MARGHLEANLLDGVKLRDTQVFGRQDPYCVFQLGTVRVRSRVAEDGGTKPKWNERISLGTVSTSGDPQLLVEVYNDQLGKDELIGGVIITLGRVFASGFDDVRAPLRSRDGKAAGELNIILKWTPEGGAALAGAHKPPKTAPGAWAYAGGAAAGGAVAANAPGYPPQAAAAPGYPPAASAPYPPQATAAPGYPPPAGAPYPPSAPPAGHSYPPPAGSQPHSSYGASAAMAAAGAAVGAAMAASHAGYPPPAGHVAPPGYAAPAPAGYGAPPPTGYPGAYGAPAAPYGAPAGYPPQQAYAAPPPAYYPSGGSSHAMTAAGMGAAAAAVGMGMAYAHHPPHSHHAPVYSHHAPHYHHSKFKGKFKRGKWKGGKWKGGKWK